MCADTTPDATPAADQSVSLPYAWVAHPVRERPVRGLLAILLMLACGVLVALIVADPMMGPLAAGGAILFLFLTLNRFFLPTRYLLDEQGVRANFPLGARSIRWDEIRRFPHDRDGGYLSARARGGAFDTRGISLLFAGRSGEIVALIDRHRSAP